MFINNRVYFTKNLKSENPIWILTRFPSPLVVADANGNNRAMGKFMAVDPANADIVVVATPKDGAFYTTGGTTGGSWSQITAVGKSGDDRSGKPGNQLVAFDPSSSVLRARDTRYLHFNLWDWRFSFH